MGACSMSLTRRMVAAVVALGLLAPGVGWAQEAGGDFVADPENPNVVYKKKTEYDFDDDLVEGSFVKPEGDYLSSRRGGRQTSLIRIRENFVPEMLKSAEDI
jgi:hypothetical protein